MVVALALAPVSFAVAMAWGPWLVRELSRRRMGKRIRLEGQEHHLGKSGTPTMGGILFLATALLVIAAAVRDARVVVPIAVTVALYGAFGALDDYANVRSDAGLGLSVRVQIAVQLAFGLVVGALLYAVYGVDVQRVPLAGSVSPGAWTIPLAALVLLATTAGSNLIDGLDGLCAGTSAIAVATYGVIAAVRQDAPLAGACAALVGALLAYLWFNVHPARVFMGGVGSLGVGAALATIALLSGDVLLLPVVAAPFVVVTGSVAAQVAWFKATGGRRLLRRAPLQHHFELIGVPEQAIVTRFWIFGACSAAVGALLVG